MAIVTVVNVRGRRAFSGDAAARVVGDVGDRRDGAPRPFGCHAVMIAHACASGCFGVVGPTSPLSICRLSFSFSFLGRASLPLPKVASFSRRRRPRFTSRLQWLHPQPIVVFDPLPWTRSTATEFALHELVNSGKVEPNVEGAPPAWIVPPATDREPNPPFGYVVSFIRLHERGFTTLASRFMRGLCYHYRVELHNFASNTISQAATFVSICEGLLRIPVNWHLWIHLFRAELHTVATSETSWNSSSGCSPGWRPSSLKTVGRSCPLCFLMLEFEPRGYM
jgi:hypothetical protein